MPSDQSRPSENGVARSDDTGLAIDARDVHVTYADGTEAVRGVSLQVERGAFFGFLGPNGAGKTTTIRTLVTLLHPTRGTVRINGYETATAPQAVRQSIGYMAQETSIDRELTPRENLQLACDLYGVPERERTDRIDALLELVDLEAVADSRAGTFSGGMQKRLDAATVLVHRPPVVFLDEPTTGLDPEARLRLWDYFERINDRGTTVFLTTQYLAEADRLCDRLSLLQDGRIVATGTPAELKSEVGGDVVEISLADPSEQRTRAAVQAIRRVDALADATVEPTSQGVSVRTPNPREVTSDLVVALGDAGFSVTTFDVRSPTLDDAFLALTDDDPETDDGTAGAAPQASGVVK
ncbi:ABC transporter ATP-binding protein [Halorientalis marina]|uniref:ABC transporter ATP-binding protein n=1 Tax=Halorientalis marina TaxID=2931976 RepID=UPI001FF122B7|nr:ATP-binding cassette domain-containing protein [Halorientalis marina]